MKNIWKIQPQEFESSASVVDDTLVLSLPDAINPIVWRMELTNVKASALEVRPMDDGKFILVLKNPKGDVHNIAIFNKKEDAINALMNVSNALKSAPIKKVVPFQNYQAENSVAQTSSSSFLKPDEGAIKWLIALGGVLIVVILFAYMSKNSPNISAGQDSLQGSVTSTAPTMGGSSAQESGVPQSADDLLKGF